MDRTRLEKNLINLRERSAVASNLGEGSYSGQYEVRAAVKPARGLIHEDHARSLGDVVDRPRSRSGLTVHDDSGDSANGGDANDDDGTVDSSNRRSKPGSADSSNDDSGIGGSSSVADNSSAGLYAR